MKNESATEIIHCGRIHIDLISGFRITVTIQNERTQSHPEASATQLMVPFKTPPSEASWLGSGLFRAKWEVGDRLIGPDSWTRKLHSRISYETWVLSNVKGGSRFLLWRLGVKTPFRARVSGREYEIINSAEGRALSSAIWESYRPLPFREEKLGEQMGVFRFTFANKELAFYYDGDRFGTLIVLRDFFVGEPYSGLDVSGLDVVDVGSSFGDTPIYFCLRGARRVFAFEPYPATYALAKRNISENGFDQRITILNEGAGASGWMRLTSEKRNFWANAIPATEGVNIRFNSLNDIVTRFGIEKAALKFHGEGSEYEFLLGASREDLSHFPQIVLKYHYGAGRILEKLKESGFSILRKWDLHFSYNTHSSHPRYEAGMILAKKNDSSQ